MEQQVQICSPKTWKAETEGSVILGQPQLHSVFEDRVDYNKVLYLKQNSAGKKGSVSKGTCC